MVVRAYVDFCQEESKGELFPGMFLLWSCYMLSCWAFETSAMPGLAKILQRSKAPVAKPTPQALEFPEFAEAQALDSKRKTCRPAGGWYYHALLQELRGVRGAGSKRFFDLFCIFGFVTFCWNIFWSSLQQTLERLQLSIAAQVAQRRQVHDSRAEERRAMYWRMTSVEEGREGSGFAEQKSEGSGYSVEKISEINGIQ